MTEIRSTSSTGGQKGVKAEMLALLPKEGLDAVSRIFAYGARKYAAHNWRRGYDWSKSMDACLRHLLAHNNGQTYDVCKPDCEYRDEDWCPNHSRLPHLASAGFHVLVGLTWLETQGEGPDNPFDDRWPSAMERADRESAAKEDVEAEAITSILGPITFGPPDPETGGSSVIQVTQKAELARIFDRAISQSRNARRPVYPT